MGPIVIQWLHPQPATVAGAEPRPDDAQVASRLSGAVALLWSSLASSRFLCVVGILLAIWMISVAVVPALRPGGLTDADAGMGRQTYAWDMVYPAASWALRLLLAALLVALAIRAAQGAIPSRAGLTIYPEPVTLVMEVANGTTVPGGEPAAWMRVWSVLGAQGRLDEDTAAGAGARQALVVPRLGRRLASQMLTIGSAICVIGCLLALGGAVNIISPALLAGAVTPLMGMDGVTLRVLDVSDGQASVFREALRATLSWVETDSAPSTLLLSRAHWSLHRGRWARVVDVLPALTLRVRDTSGSTLSLQPVVGDRQAVQEYREVLAGAEEQVLTVPDAHIVLRILSAPDESGYGPVLVEALDGGLGTSLGSLRPDEQSSLSIDGITVEARLEQACVISLWRLPGLEFVMLGLLTALVGAILSRRHPAWRMWVGIAPGKQEPEWQVLLASYPPGMATSIAQRLGESPRLLNR
jgi:hypothetical protein